MYTYFFEYIIHLYKVKPNLNLRINLCDLSIKFASLTFRRDNPKTIANRFMIRNSYLTNKKDTLS